MSRYDHWLTTTPEDEADAAAERRARQEAAAARAELDPEPHYPRPQRVYAAYRWCPIRKCAVPDTAGTLAHPEDYIA